MLFGNAKICVWDFRCFRPLHHCLAQDFSACTTQQPAGHVQLVFHSRVPFSHAWLILLLVYPPVFHAFSFYNCVPGANSRQCRIGARLVDKATADDDAPTPGYLYNDLASACSSPLFFIFAFRFFFRFYYI
jgi:hypothetical protein